MTLIAKITFWVSLAAIAYNYAGYVIVLCVLGFLAQVKSDVNFLSTRRDRRRGGQPALQPTVAIILSALNEEAVIEARVKNLLEVSYPSELLEILIGLDSPADATPQIVDQFRSSRVRIFHFSTRRGKLAVISDLAKKTQAEILVLTDANTMFESECVANLVRHFSDPRVGSVSGEEIRVTKAGIDAAAEGLYWHYESALKILESRVGCLHSVNGGVCAIRRNLFEPAANLIVEDFQVPLDLRFRGYRIIYDPSAVSVEEIAPTFTSQFERRVRLGAGNFQTLFGHPAYLNPLKGRPAFAYWSHRVLRWATPFFLVLIFACTMALASDRIYRSILEAQCALYGMALLGFWRKTGQKSVGVFRGPLYFCTMNLALAFGFFRFLRGSQGAVWNATPRHTAKGEPLQSRRAIEGNIPRAREGSSE
jgi:cellulose synthase/poly-beta-1,6-N-acetylglucosamine synthase-like glycosyltransferase